MRARHIWTAGLLVLLTACNSENPLPKEIELPRKIPGQKLTSLSQLLEAPSDALVCVLGPYEAQVPAGGALGKSINDALKKRPLFPWPGHLPEEYEWLLAIAYQDHVHIRKYDFNDWVRPLLLQDFRTMADRGWSVKLPDGFTPTQCAPMKTAAFYRTGFDRSYLVFGTLQSSGQ